MRLPAPLARSLQFDACGHVRALGRSSQLWTLFPWLTREPQASPGPYTRPVRMAHPSGQDTEKRYPDGYPRVIRELLVRRRRQSDLV